MYRIDGCCVAAALAAGVVGGVERPEGEAVITSPLGGLGIELELPCR